MTTDRTASRLTPEDVERIDAATDLAVTRWAGAHHTGRHTVTAGAETDTLARIAHHAIGCTAHDLRPTELDAIAERIADRYTGRTFRRHAVDWRRPVEVPA